MELSGEPKSALTGAPFMISGFDTAAEMAFTGGKTPLFGFR